MDKYEFLDKLKYISEEIWGEEDWELLYESLVEIDADARRRQAYYEKRMKQLACDHEWEYEYGTGLTFASKHGGPSARKCPKCEKADRALHRYKTVQTELSWDSGQTWEPVLNEDRV